MIRGRNLSFVSDVRTCKNKVVPIIIDSLCNQPCPFTAFCSFFSIASVLASPSVLQHLLPRSVIRMVHILHIFLEVSMAMDIYIANLAAQ